MDLDTTQPHASLLLPGESLPEDLTTSTSTPLRLGPGLFLSHDPSNPAILPQKAGRLQNPAPNSYYIESSQKRYVPAVGESVIAQVTGKHVDGYKLDIGSAHPAQLDALAFEGATKKNRPMLNIGSLVYARVTLANKDMEPELECIDPTTGKSGGFGELVSGYIFSVSLPLCRRLLLPNPPVLLALAGQVAFEIAVGVNGRIWVKSGDVGTTIAVVEAVRRSEFLRESEVGRMVKEVLAQVGERAQE
ncbi:exosome non-catalytic core subunit rrp40 [Saitoella coloradoensis]